MWNLRAVHEGRRPRAMPENSISHSTLDILLHGPY